MNQPDPFAALGLPAEAGLTDADVRAAWRRIAGATHPDRADGGDPARFAAAAAAYHLLRTAAGRGEALADLAVLTGTRAAARRAGRARRLMRGRPAQGSLAARAGRLGRRLRGGRPGRLALRAAAAAVLSATVITAAGTRPAVPAVIAGLLTWLVLTGRHDLAPPG
jgi:curved DNA-binding protein CbpA